MSCHRFRRRLGSKDLGTFQSHHPFGQTLFCISNSCRWFVYVDVWIQSLIEVVGPAGPEDLLGKAPPEAPLEAPTSPEVSWFINTMAKMAKKIGNIADLRVLPLTPWDLQHFIPMLPEMQHVKCLLDSYRKSSALHGRSLHWWNETLVRQQQWCWDTQHWPIRFLIFDIHLKSQRSRNGQTVEISKLSKQFGQMRAVDNLDLVLHSVLFWWILLRIRMYQTYQSLILSLNFLGFWRWCTRERSSHCLATTEQVTTRIYRAQSW